ncbi:MAG: hypothetical protein JWQ98_1040 [Chlorobi bacterium]|nr:hypothetical protein [Chlorobiota bacterium]
MRLGIRSIPLFSILLILSACTENAPTTPGTTDSTATVSLASMYSTLPDVANGNPGVLKESERQKALNYVNAIRSLHKLPLVAYHSADDAGITSAALIIAANNTLDHNPQPSLKFWSQAGADASSKSNLSIHLWSGSNESIPTTETIIDGWLADSANAFPGHRAWLLSPFLKWISFSRVDKPWSGSEWGVDGAVIKVIYTDEQNANAMPVDFVAYPFETYPARLVNSEIDYSFSVIADRSGMFANSDKVKYDNATISIVGEHGEKAPVGNVRADYQNFGIPNHLLWRTSLQSGVRYTVSINNVVVNGQSRNYSYYINLSTTV